MKQFFTVLLYVLAIYGSGCLAQSSQVFLYSDSRIVNWSKDFLAGRKQAVLQSVEQDLQSSTPHPLSMLVWNVVSRSLGTQDASLARLQKTPVYDQLKTVAEIHQLYSAGEYRQVVEKYPVEKAQVIKNPYSLNELVYSAEDITDYASALDYALIAWEVAPTYFRTTIQILDIYENNIEQAKRIDKLIQPGGKLYESATGRFIQQATAHLPLSTLNTLTAVEAWLKQFPDDPRAIGKQADLLNTLQRYEQAISLYEWATVHFPFINWLNEKALAQLRLQLKKEARATLSQKLLLESGDSTRLKTELDELYADALLDVGDKGDARSVLEKSLKINPRHPQKQYLMGRLELESNRLSVAIPFLQTAVALDSTDQGNQLYLLRALEEADRLPDAVNLLNKLKRSPTYKSKDFYYRAGNIYGKLKQYADAIQLYTLATTSFPQSKWMNDNYAYYLDKAGEEKKALQTLEYSIHLKEPDQWEIDKLKELMTKAKDSLSQKNLQHKLAVLQQEFPYTRRIWEEMANQFTPKDFAQRKKVWEQALLANPSAYWPWELEILFYVNREQWNKADSVAFIGLNQVKKYNDKNSITSSYIDKIWITYQRSTKESVSKTDIELALSQLDTLCDLGGPLGTYYFYKSKFLTALNQPTEAGLAWLKLLQYYPDNSDYHWQLATRHSEAVGRGKAYAAYYRFVKRDEYNYVRWSNWRRLHAIWSGSPIVALQVGKLIRERFPDRESKLSDDEASAYGHLGDNSTNYLKGYDNSLSVSTSNRYINWFENTRKNAQKEVEMGGINVKLDENETGACEIIFPNGRIVRRKDHPISGKAMLIQVGVAKATCEYDENGDNLRKVTANGNKWVKLTYDSLDQIKTLTTDEGKTLWFVYNENHKPVQISVKGVGTIKVTYTPEGEVENVSSLEEGKNIASRVTTAFQRLLDLIKPFGERNAMQVPDLPFEDQKLDSLRSLEDIRLNNLESAKNNTSLIAYYKVADILGQYLLTHIQDKESYAEEAKKLYERLFELGHKSQNEAIKKSTLKAVQQWYTLMQRTRRHGVGRDEWEIWGPMQEWVTWLTTIDPATQLTQRQLLVEIRDQPLLRLEGALWLPKSYLSRDGLWRKYKYQEVLPGGMSTSADALCLLVRRNNEVVIGTTKGLSVLRQGHWQKFIFDESTKQFSKNADPYKTSGASSILSIAEDSTAGLWVGTATGLFHIADAYDGPAKRYSTRDGLPADRINQLAAYASGVLVGTNLGLRYVANDTVSLPIAWQNLANKPISLLRSTYSEAPSEEHENDQSATDTQSEPTLIGASNGLYALQFNSLTLLTSNPVDDAVWEPNDQRVYLLRNGQAHIIAWNGQAKPATEQDLPEQRNIIKSSKINAVSLLPLGEDRTGVTYLTDRGLSIYYGWHIEHRELPNADRSIVVQTLATRNRRTYLLTSDGVYAIEYGQQMGDSKGKVFDLLTDPVQHITYVARGLDGLAVVSHANIKKGAETLDNYYATHMAMDKQGRLLVNDGNERIMRYEKGNASAATLFTINQTVAGSFQAGSVTSMIVASDGTVWVTAGASLFRWKEGEAEEFSIFKNDKIFPARSEMLSQVFETVDGRIWVIASNESHLDYKGQTLSGGVLEWTGEKFIRLDLKEKTNNSEWFMTSYTPIADKLAIVGTASGFARHDGKHFARFTELKDTTYALLKDAQPMLWLGTRGAKLGTTWLFGTAGGLVAYQDGQWFNPSRLNWMLPEDAKFGGSYGVRTVHAVATDSVGRIYAGTDRGLLIYDSGSGDEQSFLITNHFERAFAFKLAEQQRLHREASFLLGQVSQESEVGRLLNQVRENEKEIERLRSMLDPNLRLLPVRTTAQGLTVRESAPESDEGGKRKDESNGVFKIEPSAILSAELQDKLKANLQLMDKIRQENPAFYQLLRVEPPDLIALRNKLSPQQVALQYLPTDQKLYIQVVSRDGIDVREVVINRKELYERTLNTAYALAHNSGKPRGVKVEGRKALTQAELDSNLLWLYDQLLRPVESDLQQKQQVFIVPVGSLSYLPFGALLRSAKPKLEYAVEHYNFGYMPTLYHFALFLQQRSQDTKYADAIIFGDPDGSLAGARMEATKIHQLLKATASPYIGKEARFETLTQKSPKASIVHLGTHGYFSKASPEGSYLLFANDRKVTFFDLTTLPLKKTDMVVLAACETGLGADGLEYSTLARSFAWAGSPSVIATLWCVNDAASMTLMETFYQNLMNKDDRFTALAKAQRQLLNSGDKALASPSAWAGFIPFGKP